MQLIFLFLFSFPFYSLSLSLKGYLHLFTPPKKTQYEKIELFLANAPIEKLKTPHSLDFEEQCSLKQGIKFMQ